MNELSERTRVWAGVGAAILVGSLLALQGWRARVPSLDLIPHVDDAERLVRDGVVPEKGCLSSFGAYIPPGPTWLFAPGVAMGLPARLVEYPAALALFALTAVGIVLLANLCFGAPTGVWAAAVYCVSDRGLFFASTLWPRGHPAFVVWTVYFLCRWAAGRRGAWLGAATASFAAGMYVFMEIAPLALAVPLIWLRYRPPIRIVPLFWAAVFAAVVWAPYLRLEWTRDGRDLRAILTKTPLPLGDYKATMCNPRADVVEFPDLMQPFDQWENRKAPAATLEQGWRRLRHAAIGLTENFGPRSGAFVVWLAILGYGVWQRLRSRGAHQSPADAAEGAFWRALLVPWILLLLMPEGGADLAGRRFWWLWPLQAVGAVGALLIFFQWVWWRGRIAAALVLFTLCSGMGALRLADWRKDGFGGSDSERWLICRRIAEEAAPKTTTRVGYAIEVWAHALKFRPFDRRYKIGWEWDWLLRYDFGVRNEINCPEGVANDADFEVVERNLPVKFASRLVNTEFALAADAGFGTALSERGVRLVAASFDLLFPRRFNRLVSKFDNKALVERRALQPILARLLGDPELPATVSVVVDRLGGRKFYREMVEELAEGAFVFTSIETPTISTYVFERAGRRIEMTFAVAADAFSLPTALASMVAKYLRECAMVGFNAFWGKRVPGLRPTAGYYGDAFRFHKDVRPHLKAHNVKRAEFWRAR